MTMREDVTSLVNQAIEAACADGALVMETKPDPGLERPKDASNGDWASTVALRSAKLARKPPRQIAEIILAHLPESELVSSCEVAGPGFINFTLAPSALQSVITTVRAERDQYGRCDITNGKPKVNLEYVSANPTGPMHVGHGRWAALGDALGRLLRHCGYEVCEEFYINDHGVQMAVFAESIVVRYQQICGLEVSLPERSYGGAYVTDIAQAIFEKDGNRWLFADEQERLAAFRAFGYEMMLGQIQATLEQFGASFDRYFSESSLYEPDDQGKTAVDRAFDAFMAEGYVYEKDGAQWFRSSLFGDEKDRVLIKANGEFSYFMSDCAYHYDKLQRGFDRLIDIWGADHHGYVPRCEAMMAAWGRPGDLEVVLGQLVNLFRDGELVRMSKRTGDMVSFQELIDEVGVDATRFLMLSRSSDQPIDFDIEVAKKKDATNPVYYVQYAHARICSILKKAARLQGGDEPSEQMSSSEIDALAASLIPPDADLSLLTEASELALLRKMDSFGELVADAARDRAPFRLTHYAQDLAALFHSFYTECQVIGDDPALTQARLALVDATRLNLAQTLGLLGVSAPCAM